jgi:hypothetical protein
MRHSQFLLSVIIVFMLFLVSCKKHEVLPELDPLGNNMNPKSGTEYVRLDSSRVYTTGTGKYLKSYVSIDANSISAMGFTWSKINVYKNGNSGTFLPSTLTNKFFIDNVVSGQIMNFEFTVVETTGRESKKSKQFIVVVP